MEEKKIYICTNYFYYFNKEKTNLKCSSGRFEFASFSEDEAIKRMKEIAESIKWLFETGGNLITDMEECLLDDCYPCIRVHGWSKDYKEIRLKEWEIKSTTFIEEGEE